MRHTINDFNLGDFVRYNHELYGWVTAEVIELLQDVIWVQLLDEREYGEKLICKPCEIMYIPITDQCLTYNGFERLYENHFYSNALGCSIDICGKYSSVRIKSARQYMPIRIEVENIKYIHELQQVIRLAKKDDKKLVMNIR
jgi:hypothetical protein